MNWGAKHVDEVAANVSASKHFEFTTLVGVVAQLKSIVETNMMDKEAVILQLK